MRLSDIMSEMHDVAMAGRGDPGILSIASDSREVDPGALFAALPGSREDGIVYIRDAIDRGAAAVITDRMPSFEPLVPYIVAADARKALGEAADIFYNHPSQTLDLIGVTGTNGKTTTAFLIRHIMNHAARRCGMLGTIEYDLGDRVEPAPLTTPDTVRFAKSLAEMRDFGCRAAVAEVSSHALSQDRVSPHRFACAVFTNLTRDHLDYHGDMETYLAAKRSLFERLDDKAVAVINLKDEHGLSILGATKAKAKGYFLAGAGEKIPTGAIRAEITKTGLGGQHFTVDGFLHAGDDFFTPLVGRHNVENCIGALLATAGLGVGIATIQDALTKFPGVPGRLERLEAPNGAKVFVDYAHTDDALRSVLSVLRPLVGGKLITVFGCGGDRDKGKRPLMAKAAESLSDMVVVTSDNPRTENPHAIIQDIMPGFARPDAVAVREDRVAAIKFAVHAAGRDDAVLIAGKGHEDYQIIGSEKIHMDDREIARQAFREM